MYLMILFSLEKNVTEIKSFRSESKWICLLVFDSVQILIYREYYRFYDIEHLYSESKSKESSLS